jgi:hypothetical protein
LLGARPWHLADVADLLDCTEDEAGALLTGVGFAPREDTLWVAADDEGSRMLRGNIEIVIHAPYAKNEAVEEKLRLRLDALERNGRAEPVNWGKLRDDLPDDEAKFPPPPENDNDQMSPRDELQFGVQEISMGVTSVGRALAGAVKRLRTQRRPK